MTGDAALPEGFDKLGAPERGQQSPGRCHVCLAWVKHPFKDPNSPSHVVCPSCKQLPQGKRAVVRERVSEALQPVWDTYQQSELEVTEL
jgi:hypothetical protein